MKTTAGRLCTHCTERTQNRVLPGACLLSKKIASSMFICEDIVYNARGGHLVTPKGYLRILKFLEVIFTVRKKLKPQKEKYKGLIQ